MEISETKYRRAVKFTLMKTSVPQFCFTDLKVNCLLYKIDDLFWKELRYKAIFVKVNFTVYNRKERLFISTNKREIFTTNCKSIARYVRNNKT